MNLNKSAAFNKAFQSLSLGADPYQIIDQLCTIIDNQNELLIKSETRNIRPFLLGVVIRCKNYDLWNEN